MNSIKNSLLISFLPFFLFANQTVFNWESMTSLINSNSITQDDNGYIIGATSGGIISLGDEVQIMKSFLNDINLSLDSRMYSANCSKQIEIFKSGFTIGTIKFENDNFYKRLREKLFWGQDMRNQNLNR